MTTTFMGVWSPTTQYWGTTGPNNTTQNADEVEWQGGYWIANYYSLGVNPMQDMPGSSGYWAPDTSKPGPVYTPVAPETPTGLQVGYTSSNSAALFWTASEVKGIGDVSSYNIYENGVKIGTSATTSFNVTGLNASTTYAFTVDAVDGSGASAQTATVTASTTAVEASSGKYFSPYVDMTLPSTDLQSLAAGSGLKDFTLAFMQGAGLNADGSLPVDSTGALPSGWVPTVSLGGLSRLTESAGTILQEVKSVEALGGTVTASFGGYGGRDPAYVAEEYENYLQGPHVKDTAAQAQAAAVANLQGEYQSVINTYGVNSLDFDIEPDAMIVNGSPDPSTFYDNVTDATETKLRDLAIAGLEKANPGVKVSFTLQTERTGLSSGDKNLLVQAKADGVRVDVVNIMAMDYGDGTEDMATSAINAAKGVEAELVSLGMTSTKVAITPMIGQNDSTDEIFTIADAKALEAFAASTPWVAGLGMWELPRDNGSTAGMSGAQSTGSNLDQTPFEFSSIFDAIETIATVSVAEFEADVGSPNGGFAVVDKAASIKSALPQLEANNGFVATITATDAPISVNVKSFTADQAVLDKVVGGFTVSDTAANIQAVLPSLAADANVTTVKASGGPLSETVATFTADKAALDKVSGGFTVADTAAHIASAIGALSGDTHLTAITLTSGTGSTSSAFSLGHATTLNLGTSVFSTAGTATFPAPGTASTTITGSSGSRLMTKGATTLGKVTIGGSAELENLGFLTQSNTVTLGDSSGSAAMLYNAAGSTYRISNNTGIGLGTSAASKITNAGLFEKTGGSGVSAIAPAVANSGTIAVVAGTLDFKGAITGTGKDTISGSATLEFDGAVAAGQTVSFASSAGHLALHDAPAFAGTVAGLVAGDVIDIGAFANATVKYVANSTNTGGKLTVTSGTTKATIALDGQFVAAGFHVAADSAGGTDLTYAAPAQNVATKLLTAAHA